MGLKRPPVGLKISVQVRLKIPLKKGLTKTPTDWLKIPLKLGLKVALMMGSRCHKMSLKIRLKLN